MGLPTLPRWVRLRLASAVGGKEKRPGWGDPYTPSHVWGYDYDPGSNVVDVYVGYLRRKVGDRAIETVRGMGYRLQV